MFALYKKELATFFSSLTGYITIIVFLLFNGLFIWVIPSDNNILYSGYAGLDSYFALSPWLFMFLIPAITMRLFSEEQKTGTIELLVTKPITDLQIVTSKFLSALSIALIAILPTFIYFISVYYLGNPIGNLDIGGTWGAYIGLIFLTCSYVAIGVFSSALSDNQVVSFILATVLIFVFYTGMDYISQMFSLKKGEYFLQGLSMNRHYLSLSRGVIDTRDLIFFISISIGFILLTKFKLQTRKW